MIALSIQPARCFTGLISCGSDNLRQSFNCLIRLTKKLGLDASYISRTSSSIKPVSQKVKLENKNFFRNFYTLFKFIIKTGRFSCICSGNIHWHLEPFPLMKSDDYVLPTLNILFYYTTFQMFSSPPFPPPLALMMTPACSSPVSRAPLAYPARC